MIRFPAPGRTVKILAMSELQLPEETNGPKAAHDEFDVKFGLIGASAPFGRSDFPLPVKSIHYEHPGPVPERVLEEERH
ncbi:hypothetical protein GCM10029992_16320 [Glycomyces albus]